MKKISIIILVAAMLSACSNSPQKNATSSDDTLKRSVFNSVRTLFQAVADKAENPANPLSPEKIELGKKLYNDVRLSKDNSVSCNTCHNLATYGVDNKPTSTGVGGALGSRNSPTVLNAAFHGAQFWDGRMKDVEEQAGGPILNPVEMAIPNEAFLVKKIKSLDEYKELFKKAFPGAKDPVTFENIRLAIAAFERTLIAPAPFDAYLKGDTNALTLQQAKGLKAFVDNGCMACHNGPLLGGNMFQKFGIFGDYWTMTKSVKIDSGKVKISKDPGELYFFKAMPLRNIEKTGPYFHDGSVGDLKDAIKIMGKLELNKDFSTEEVDNIYAFLQSLTSKQ